VLMCFEDYYADLARFAKEIMPILSELDVIG
jgi:hypothetical protein